MARHGEKLSTINERGEYELIEPLDTKILEMLPEKGTLFAGLYPLGETASAISKKLSTKEWKVPSSAISNRLRMLAVQGLTVKTKSVSSGGGSTVWQRTKESTQLLALKKKETTGGGVNSGTSG